MLDIFSNVFGKSKKSSASLGAATENNGSPSTSRRGDGNNQDGDAEGFTFVTQTSLDHSATSVYPTILTDEVKIGTTFVITRRCSSNRT